MARLSKWKESFLTPPEASEGGGAKKVTVKGTKRTVLNETMLAVDMLII